MQSSSEKWFRCYLALVFQARYFAFSVLYLFNSLTTARRICIETGRKKGCNRGFTTCYNVLNKIRNCKLILFTLIVYVLYVFVRAHVYELFQHFSYIFDSCSALILTRFSSCSWIIRCPNKNNITSLE